MSCIASLIVGHKKLLMWCQMRRHNSYHLFSGHTIVQTWICVITVFGRWCKTEYRKGRLTSLPKVIWEERRVAAVSQTYAVKSLLVTMARPKFTPENTPSHGPIPKPHYVPHPWTHPTYDAKQHPDRICHFSTMHWTDPRTDRQIVHGKVWSL